MAFKKPSTHVPAPEGPDRLFRDLPRRKHASLYDHQGQVLRTYVSEALNASDVALQLPTGSGKTLVGLLLAEWRRRKYGERVVYLCPTRQLVGQVCDEASSKYGLSVQAFTGSARNYHPDARSLYLDGKGVAVTTYNSLFNTNPFFDDPDIILIDDAHTAENYIASQWTVRIRNFGEDEGLFHAVAAVLRSVLSETSYNRLMGGHNGVDAMMWVDKVPSNKLATIAQELCSVVSGSVGESEQRYAWSMLADHLVACQVYVACSEVMIRPLIPPTWKHRPFAEATQRIFMSATLGAGGDLERLTGRANITRLAIPEGWDHQGIGRRFFIFPEKSLTEEETVDLRRSLMRTAGRSLVLTPTNEAAADVREDVISTLGFPVSLAEDLESSRTHFVEKKNAVAVVANRYDGIDFPDNDCRLLFVEGLPRATNLQERFLMTRMGANLLFNDRVQTRVLQAVGRCTRGLNDYSAVVVTGEDLPAYLTDRRRRKHFHPELQAELEFGVDQSSEVDVDTFRDNFRVFLEHESEWEAANENILEARASAVQEPFPAMDHLALVVKHEITWQQAMWGQDYAMAYEAARDVLGGLKSPELRGYRALWHYLAGSAAELASEHNYVDLSAQARTQFRMAKDAARGIPWLVALAHGSSERPSADEHRQTTDLLQVEHLEGYLNKLGTVHNRAFAAREKKIRDGLRSGALFEQAQVLLGQHLGFMAGKREADASPDPWWQIGDIVIVFEDHANADATTAVIDATKARQAASHPDWIRHHVPGAADARIIQSVLVTPAKKARPGAMPHLVRVAYWELGEFRSWAESVLETVRRLRRSFREPGDLAWRADAASALAEAKADATGLSGWLETRLARDHLEETP
ncbi:DEAD/DEAH box helicase [Ectothiorhodospira sp. BSL-9]|uniref:DEAD/DEAH box helicase n=1 Tax=Ectothiorhodospira sp. BSL-9 TaxID=1442136 RepID=UPI0007B42A82|nr:DEAD/DEAH box helicase [Ectothiorhodospira sp. BSL-9]ANB01991.1 DEAD/DEAH box helicase [Ectothiorhodospira sp. BSL-9]